MVINTFTPKVLIIIILGILITSTALAVPQRHQVNGGGTVYFEGYGKETYGFTALQVDDVGGAKGNMQIVWHYEYYPGADSPLVLHADVRYLAVDTNTRDAWIGAIITTYGWEGIEYYIQVRDGRDSGPDMIGYTYFGSENAIKALNMWNGPLFEWTNGNVRLK